MSPYRFRLPLEISDAIDAHGQIKSTFIREAIQDCIAEPRAFADRPFYHFVETDRKATKYVSPEVTAGERKVFKAMAAVLHVTERDLVSNALVRKLGMEKEVEKFTPPATHAMLVYDYGKMADLVKQNINAKTNVASGEKPAEQEPEQPRIQIFSSADMRNILAGPRPAQEKVETRRGQPGPKLR